MTQNVGTIDKILRVIIGLGLTGLVFFGPQTPWGWLGVVPLTTALLGFCTLYSLIGVSTRFSPGKAS